jgi:peptide/nickel transport system substrate-binding protein
MRGVRCISMTAVSLAIGLGVGAVGSDAFAQKSKDLFRMPEVRDIATSDPYVESGSPNRFLAEAVHDNLIAYDEVSNKVAPLLAKSWAKIDDKTYEFEINDTIKWQDGQKFTVDDVVYTLNWLIDPKSRLRNRELWAWISKVEKVGPTKVRITSENPAPFFLTKLAYETWIYPEHIHKNADRRNDYGKSPVGTGPYKMTQFDSNKGILMTKNTEYKHGGAAKPLTNIGNVMVKIIPDPRTQVAGFMVGEWDLLGIDDPDQAEALLKNPKFKSASIATLGLVFATLDSNGISSNKALKDPRVRRALFMGVNRDELRQLYWGNNKPDFTTENLCFRFMAGCDFTDGTIKYDPEGAKKLLAEAGYANGLDLEISTVLNTAVAEIAKAMSGQLRKIGMNVKVDERTMINYRKKESEGETTIRMSIHSPRVPDVSGTTSFFFDPEGARNKYFLDDELVKLAKAADTTMDDTKRRGIMKQLLDRNARDAFIFPVASTFTQLIHTDEVQVRKGGRYEIYGFYMSDLSWK